MIIIAVILLSSAQTPFPIYLANFLNLLFKTGFYINDKMTIFIYQSIV